MLEFRSTEKEQLDNLDLGGETLHKSLDGLSLINRFLGNTNATFATVKPVILSSTVPLKIIDLGCGGGDNLRAIAKWCNANNHKVQLIGIDGNQYIVDYAQSKNTSGIQIEYQQADILSPHFELPNCDILMSSHFVYHFSDGELTQFLIKASKKVKHKIIFSELQRSPLAYSLFALGSFFMPFNALVKQDGKRAIERAFTRSELELILKHSTLTSYSIQWKWAFRYLVEIEI